MDTKLHDIAKELTLSIAPNLLPTRSDTVESRNLSLAEQVSKVYAKILSTLKYLDDEPQAKGSAQVQAREI